VKHIASTAKRWPVRRLGDLLVRHNEIIHPGDRKNGEATFVGLEHIEPNTGRRTGSLTIDLGKLTGRKPTFHRGQIVYGYLRPYLNKVWIADFDGCSSVDQFAFDVRTDVADTAFLAAFMRSETFLRRSEVVTTTGQLPRISIDEIARVPIELPSIADQRRIAAHLEQALAMADDARRAAEDRVAAAEALPAACFRDVFEGPDSGEWTMRMLGDVVVENGQYGTSQRSNSEGRGLPVLGMPHIHEGRIRWESVSFADLSADDVRKYRLEKGDILFNRTNSAELVGKSAVFDEERDAVFASYLIRYRTRPGIADPNFVCSYINSRLGRMYIERHMARAIGQVNISASTMHSMPVPCPPLSVQQRVGEGLSRQRDAADSLVRRCRDELAAIQAIPGSLLRAAFNGAS
jgi:type I restriction enzyme, S subunit